jgi:hypothetical protein
VKPASFNFTNATAHLKLAGVKHFIARWTRAKEALRASREWTFIAEADGWELYEFTANDEGMIFVPRNMPVGVSADEYLDWKNACMEWLYRIDTINQPFAILRDSSPPSDNITATLDSQTYKRYLASSESGRPSIFTSKPIDISGIRINEEKATDDCIRFKTTAIGMPHIIKHTYFPNWKSRNGEPVYMVTPCFMLIYPSTHSVELYYGSTISDNAGRMLTLAGVLALAVILTLRQTQNRRNCMKNI